MAQITDKKKLSLKEQEEYFKELASTIETNLKGILIYSIITFNGHNKPGSYELCLKLLAEDAKEKCLIYLYALNLNSFIKISPSEKENQILVTLNKEKI